MRVGKWLNSQNRNKTFALVIAFYLLLFIPFLYQQFQFALDKNNYYSFERGQSWIFRVHDAELFRDDIIADYREASDPFFYSLAERFFAQYFDPFYLNRIYPLILWLLSAPMAYYAVRAFAGHYNALFVTGIYLMSQVFLNRMVGGLAHTFTFPLMWAFLCAVLNGRTYLATLVTILSAFTYPVISPLLGVALAIWMLFPGFSRASSGCTHSNWSVNQRFILLSVAGVFTLCALYINISAHLSEGSLGSIITESDKELLKEVERAYPPIVSVAHNPVLNILLAFSNQFRGLFGWAVGAIFALILSAYLFFGCTFKIFQDARMQRLRPFAIAAISCLLILRFYDTSVIFRYIYYPLTLYFTLILPLLFRRTAKLFKPSRRLLIFFGFLFIYILMLSNPTAKGSGYSLELEASTKPILEYLLTTDKDSMVAGMPGYIAKRPIEDVHYFAKRKVLFADIYNNLYHRDFTQKMMRRLNATIDMYFAADISTIIQLRDEFGVDYMIVDMRDFMPTKEPILTHYVRVDDKVAKLVKTTDPSAFIMPKLAKSSSVISYDELYVVDLNSIAVDKMDQEENMLDTESRNPKTY